MPKLSLPFMGMRMGCGGAFGRLSTLKGANSRQILGLVDGNADLVKDDQRLCLVGRVLTDSVVHFPSTRNTLADLWHPLGRVTIIDIGEKRSLFRFYYEIDIKKVLGGKLLFNRHLILLHRLEPREDPLQ
ncbi:hypothetical protein Godav_021341, partial [Gossypium davidsonii]|nr:hypothetical protein [Gossypium davidsonii]